MKTEKRHIEGNKVLQKFLNDVRNGLPQEGFRPGDRWRDKR